MAPLRSRLPTVALCLALCATACSERVVDSRAFNDEGKLVWSSVMPSSRNTALWLRYSVTGPLSRNDLEEEGDLVYDLSGQLNFLVDKGQHYAGGIYLKPEGVAVDKVYSKGERDSVTRSCGYSSCTESGRIKLMSLHEVSAGAILDFEAWLLLENNDAVLESATLELAPN